MGIGKFNCSFGNISLSIIFIAGQSRDTGRYDVEIEGSFPGFGSGMTIEDFQIEGSWAVLIDRLNIVVKYSVPIGPMCLRCRLESLSGPSALLALHCLMALVVSLVV